ncbi:MAG TPA: outer membrane protein assembly factor BamA [Dongiaceae bacterium]|nr:outer membrane protein assembly factor BamA [Dongiaceae bacterium]
MGLLRVVFLALLLGLGIVVASGTGREAAAQTITSGEPIQQVVIEGNQRIEADTIRSYMEINPGDPFDAAKVDKALKNLFATGLFADVNFRRDGDNLVVTVVENPIINKLAFEGNDRINDDQLNQEVQLKPRQVYTQTRVQADVKRILDLYRRSGRFAATVDPKVIKLDQNRVNLVFEINEGDVTQVERIDFVGNKEFSDSTLRDEIATKESAFYRILSTTDTYDPDRLTVDKENLRKFYLSEGYADFRVISAVAELSPDQEAFFITFTVEEGERYKLGKVDIKTTLKDLNPETLRGDITTVQGDWYDASKVDDSVQALSDHVGSLGYAFVDVRPRIDRDAKNHVLNLTYDIQEGPKVYVERIDISGNVRTQDKVIRREFRLAEGDAFSTAKLRRTEQRLKNLGFFETVDITTVPSTSPDKTIIKVKVKEQSTGELTFGAGFSTSLGPLGNIGLRERNLLGKGQDVSADITISGKRSSGSISFTDPYFMDKDVSAGVDLFFRRLDPGPNLQEQAGSGLRMGYDLTEYLRQTLSYQFRGDRIYHPDHDAPQIIRDEIGWKYYSVVGQTLTYDRRDSQFDPRDGYFVTLDTHLAGLGGDVKYASGTLKGGYFLPVTKEVTLSLTNEVGYIKPLFGDYLHYPDGFFLGGADSLRGFDSRGVGPREQGAKKKVGSVGGQFLWDGTVQASFPLGLPEEYQIRGRVFSDFGVLTGYDAKSSDIKINDDGSIRASAGFGITWVSPFGPLAIDLAYPVVRKSEDKTQYFSFSFGTNF